MRTYGLLKKEFKKKSEKIIKILSSLPIIYKGDINFINDTLDMVKEKYPIYKNFIEKKLNIFWINHWIIVQFL